MNPYISAHWLRMSLNRKSVKDSIYGDEELKTTSLFLYTKVKILKWTM